MSCCTFITDKGSKVVTETSVDSFKYNFGEFSLFLCVLEINLLFLFVVLYGVLLSIFVAVYKIRTLRFLRSLILALRTTIHWRLDDLMMTFQSITCADVLGLCESLIVWVAR